MRMGCEWGGGGGAVGERILSRVFTEHRARHGARSHNAESVT